LFYMAVTASISGGKFFTRYSGEGCIKLMGKMSKIQRESIWYFVFLLDENLGFHYLYHHICCFLKRGCANHHALKQP